MTPQNVTCAVLMQNHDRLLFSILRENLSLLYYTDKTHHIKEPKKGTICKTLRLPLPYDAEDFLSPPSPPWIFKSLMSKRMHNF